MSQRIVFIAWMVFGIAPLASGVIETPVATSGSETRKSFFFTARKIGVPVVRARIDIEGAFEEDGKRFYRILAEVRSVEGLRLFFRMNNRFTATMEADTCLPLRYAKEIDQGGLLFPKKRYHQVLTFDSLHQKVVVEDEGNGEKREISLPPDTYDPLSMFGRCYLREEIQPGQEISMSIFDGLKLRQLVFHPRRENLSLRGAEQEAICLQSSTSFSTFGEKEGTIRICYSADGKKTPVAMEVSLPVGTVKFELDEALD